jgi:hypothetical protein
VGNEVEALACDLVVLSIIVGPNLLLVGVDSQKRIGGAPAKGTGRQWHDTNRTPPGLKIESGTNNYNTRYHADHPICFTYVTLHNFSPPEVLPIPIQQN